jgi:hypothetical protein
MVYDVKRENMRELPEYVVRRAQGEVLLTAAWEDAGWARAGTAKIRHFRGESSEHRPKTSVRLLHNGDAIHGIFRVEDRFVRCVRANYGSEVWKDSCVEFFAQPRPDSGYFNFEFNCGGAFLCNHILNPERAPNGFKEFTRIPEVSGSGIGVKSSLPQKIEQEMKDPVIWTLQFSIPLSLLEKYVGPIGRLNGQKWRGNFFKCAEEVSHPHWAAWSEVDEFNFHLPRCFGTIVFE